MVLPQVVLDNPWMCATCKGTRRLCGERICPLIVEVSQIQRVNRSVGQSVFGSSPPSLFVGEKGYPLVYTGPLVPTLQSDTSLYEDSTKWFDLDFSQLVSMRLSLIRSMRIVDVGKPSGRDESLMQDIAMSSRPVDAELRFTKPPKNTPSFSFYTAPMGPSAPLEKIVYVDNPRVPKPVEKVVGDADLGAAEAMVELWNCGTSDVHINRLLSMGLLGRRRKLVPTKWSITAVDDALSKHALSQVRNFPLISQYAVGWFKALGNTFSVILIPSKWRFEMLESWIPYLGVADAGERVIPCEYEGFAGRTNYANSLGGAYYAARLGVAKTLQKQRRQAAAVVLMEVDRGWIAPLGVWRVREGVKRAMTSLRFFNTFEESFNEATRKMRTHRNSWIRSSKVLLEVLRSVSLEKFF
jgi:hypothetical protein